MKRLLILITSVSTAATVFAMLDRLQYPESRRVDVVDDYFGTLVADPYRWLEDTESADTRAWIESQNALTFGFLKRIRERGAIRDRLTKLWNYERFSSPVAEGGKYFFTRNSGLQNQAVLYVADALNAEARVLLDPNKLSKDGTVALGPWSPSPNGRYLAYAIQSGGSDWLEWKVRDVVTGEDIGESIKWSKFSGASWTQDSEGFFYSRYDEPQPGEELLGVNVYQKLYYHRVGTSQSEDVLVYKRDDEREWGFGGIATEDGDYLVIVVWRGAESKNQLFYKRLRAGDSDVIELIPNFEAEYSYVANDGNIFYVQTTLDAPKGRLVAIDIDNPDPSNWKDIIPEGVYPLEQVSFVGGKFFARYLRDANSLVRIFTKSGNPDGTLRLPGLGSASGFGGRASSKETFYSFSSFTTPNTIFRYDIESGQSSVFREPRIDFRPSDYQTRQFFATSKDGTQIPIFVTHRRGIDLNGELPTLLYGYGGFSVNMTPWFSVSSLVWMEMGGVFAVAVLRGGAEYGEEWHRAGMGSRKQNVFDDFIASAEWLIENKYTNPNKLAIQGGSNGGLLVGAVVNQRPDLFGAALPAVGVMDMLRYHKFTIGWAWIPEYGSSENEDEFQTLYAYSPLHNIREGVSYPATLIATGDHDDRVVPGHSFKYAATLQAAQSGDAPILIRIETRAGHGAGKPMSMVIDEISDTYAFLVKTLGIRLTKGFGE